MKLIAVAIVLVGLVGCDVGRDRTFNATTPDTQGIVSFEASDPSFVRTSKCTCPQTVPGPDGGTRNLIKSTCYNTTHCGGTCAYLAQNSGDEDFEEPCAPIEGDCSAACLPPPSGYTLNAACTPESGFCGGVCVWADPVTGDKSYDVCGHM